MGDLWPAPHREPRTVLSMYRPACMREPGRHAKGKRQSRGGRWTKDPKIVNCLAWKAPEIVSRLEDEGSALVAKTFSPCWPYDVTTNHNMIMELTYATEPYPK